MSKKKVGVTIDEVRIVRIRTKDVAEALEASIEETPSMGEQYARTYLLRFPNKIKSGNWKPELKTSELAGVEVAVGRANMMIPGIKATATRLRNEGKMKEALEKERRIQELERKIIALKARETYYKNRGQGKKAREKRKEIQKLETRGPKTVDMLYIRKNRKKLEFFLVETKDGLAQDVDGDDNNDLIEEAKEQVERYAEGLRQFLVQEKLYNSRIYPVVAGLMYKGYGGSGRPFNEIRERFLGKKN